MKNSLAPSIENAIAGTAELQLGILRLQQTRGAAPDPVTRKPSWSSAVPAALSTILLLVVCSLGFGAEEADKDQKIATLEKRVAELEKELAAAKAETIQAKLDAARQKVAEASETVQKKMGELKDATKEEMSSAMKLMSEKLKAASEALKSSEPVEAEPKQ